MEGVGFDSLIARLGIIREDQSEKWSPAKSVGYIALLAIVFFSIQEACRLHGLRHPGLAEVELAPCK